MSLLYSLTCFLCLAIKFCSLSKAMRTGGAILFFSFTVVLAQRAVSKTLLLSAGCSSSLQFLFLSLSLRNNISCHPSHERGEGKKASLEISLGASVSFQGFPDHVYVFSLLLWSYVEVLPSSPFSFSSISFPSFSFPFEFYFISLPHLTSRCGRLQSQTPRFIPTLCRLPFDDKICTVSKCF